MPTASAATLAPENTNKHSSQICFYPATAVGSFDCAQDDWWWKANEEHRAFSAWYLENQTTGLWPKKQTNLTTFGKSPLYFSTDG